MAVEDRTEDVEVTELVAVGAGEMEHPVGTGEEVVEIEEGARETGEASEVEAEASVEASAEGLAMTSILREGWLRG